jgi:hypothetical protein
VQAEPYPWQDNQGRFTFIVDCKPLQEIICGHIPLIGDSLRPVLRRTVNNLEAILDMNWLPGRKRHSHLEAKVAQPRCGLPRKSDDG